MSYYRIKGRDVWHIAASVNVHEQVVETMCDLTIDIKRCEEEDWEDGTMEFCPFCKENEEKGW